MTVISTKPNTKIPWASEGNKAEPTFDKQLEGWVQEIPPHEIANWLEYKQDLAIKYLFQEGIPTWDSTFEYSSTSYIKYNKVIYNIKDGAEIPNVNKQPDTSPETWEVSFEAAGSSVPNSEEIEKIKNLEGYLSLYVSKAAPVMNGIATAPEFQATANGGHTFQGEGTDTGLFLNTNNEPEIKINNVTKGTVRNSPSLDSSDTTLVTTAMLQEFKTGLLDVVLPVGISIISQNANNPSTYLGFGQWDLDLEGKALVGYSSDVSSQTPAWVKTVNTVFGEYEHTQTLAELPPHNHSVTSGSNITGELLFATNFGGTSSTKFTSTTGEGEPFNVVQPSKTKFIFTRIQ